MIKRLKAVIGSVTEYLEARLAARDERTLQPIPLTVQRQRDPRDVRRQ